MNALWVALGGASGALLRYGMTTIFAAPADRFPTGTLFVNLSGCLAIGFAGTRSMVKAI